MDSFRRSFDLPVTVLRPFNTYGPRQSARAIVPTIISQALEGSTLRLGALHTRRDLTFVEDTGAAFLAAATTDAAIGRTIHLGTDSDVSIGDLVELVGELLGRELEVQTDPARVRPANSEVQRLLASPALAREVLGWEPRVDLRAGLARTIEWIERNVRRYRVGDYVI
jgi:nucleoside-diphosphate-sugar epimerase